MGFFQVGFEVTRLPKETNLSTPMFVDKIKTNNMANTNSKFYCWHLSLAAMVSGIYIITNAWIISCLLYSPIAASPTVHHRPILALIGTMMAGTLAVTVLVTVLLKPNDNRQHT
ncbi:hypothetical protein F5883DRAFT_657808 [Diaporthe sp. PMI_573]|nr:hypothetical protein F5883DRAFT_657808 [Diaporthaceae sp. PMI_573]